MAQRKEDLLEFLERSRYIYQPLYSWRTLEYVPHIHRLMRESFYYAMSSNCILHVSKNGYKCFGKHSKKQQCGNSRFLNDRFFSYRYVNFFFLIYNDFSNEFFGEYDYELLELMRMVGFNYIIEPIYVILFLLMLFIFAAPLVLHFILSEMIFSLFKRIALYEVFAFLFEFQFQVIYILIRKMLYSLF